MNIVFAIIIGVAVIVGMRGSVRMAEGTVASNRTVEWPENEKSEPLSQQALHWTIAHVRDDLGGIYAMLVVTNGCLAGLLAAAAILVLR
jgi:hypothetical protein